MLADFNPLERNIEILSELTGINIEVKVRIIPFTSLR